MHDENLFGCLLNLHTAHVCGLVCGTFHEIEFNRDLNELKEDIR